MLRTDFPVSADARLGGDVACFYCGALVGGQHNAGCVHRRRTVIVEFTVTMLLEKPEDHDRDLIEFGYNEGSWCSDNLIDDMGKMQERLAKGGECMCGFVQAKFIREATEEDEAEHHYGGWSQG